MTLSESRQTVIFDLDGTLVDSAVTITSTLNIMRDREKLVPLDIEEVKPFISLGAEKLLEAMLPQQNINTQTKLKDFRRLYLEAEIQPGDLFKGVSDTLILLKSLGVRLAICTNKPRLLTEKTLAATGIARQFDCIICGAEAPNDKPAPDQLLLILEKLRSQRQECLFIGDTRVDHEASLAADIPFMYFPSGYDPEIDWAKNVYQFPTKSFSPEVILETVERLDNVFVSTKD